MKSTAILAAFAAGAMMLAAPQAANASPQPGSAKHLQTSNTQTSNVLKTGYRHHRHHRWGHRHYRSPRYYRHGYGYRHGHRYYRRPGVGVYLGF